MSSEKRDDNLLHNTNANKTARNLGILFDDSLSFTTHGCACLCITWSGLQSIQREPVSHFSWFHSIGYQLLPESNLRLWCWTATGNTFSNINIRICTININKTKITIWLTGLWVWVAYNLHLKKQHTLNILPNLQWEMFIKSVVQQNTTFDNMFYSSV